MNRKTIFVLFYSSLLCIATPLFFTGCHSPQASQIVEIPQQNASKMEKMENIVGRGWGDYDRIMKYDKIMVNVKVSDKMLENSDWDDTTCRRLVASEDEDNTYIAEPLAK